MQAPNRGLTESSGEVFLLDILSHRILSHRMSVMGMLRQLREAPISKLPTAPLWLCNEQWSLPKPALVSADKMTSHVGDVRLCCVLSKALLGLTMARYLFGNYLLDLDERRLLRDNEEIRLRGKLLDTLRLLVENAGKLVRKDAFMESVWPDSVVEDNNLDN